MKKTRRRDTTAELSVRRELHKRGYRYRVDFKIVGVRSRPDIAFPIKRIAIYIDGCFWHRCPLHGTDPKRNSDWWKAKLDANVYRDAVANAALMQAGLTVRRFWEHEGVQYVVNEIIASIDEVSAARS